MNNDISMIINAGGNGIENTFSSTSSSPNIPSENKNKKTEVEKGFNPEKFFEKVFKPIDEIDIGYVIFTKQRIVNGKEDEYAINIEDYNNENRIKGEKENTKDNNENRIKGEKEIEDIEKTQLGVTLPANELYHFSINNEDLIFKRNKTIEQVKKEIENIKAQSDQLQIDKSNDELSKNNDEYAKLESHLKNLKKQYEENNIENLIRKFVEINPTIFGENAGYVTAHVFDNPEHNNEISEIKIRVNKNEKGGISTESYKFNSLPDQLYDSKFTINPLIVSLFDIWRNSILFETKNKKEEIKVEESYLYEADDDNKTNNKPLSNISEKINIYNEFVEKITSKVKTLYGSFISIENNKNIDGVFINSKVYEDTFKDIKNIDNVNLVKEISRLMKEKTEEPKKDHYYMDFDNIFTLEKFLDYEKKLKSEDIKPQEVYKDKFKKIYDAIKHLTLLEEEYVYDIREKLIKFYNEYKNEKHIDEPQLKEIKDFISAIFAVTPSNDKNIYASYYAYTLIKIIKNKLIDKINELTSMMDNDDEGEGDGKGDTDESIYSYVENFIELNGSYPNEDDIEKYKKVIKELNVNKNNMNKVENLLKERLREKGIFDAQYTIEKVQIVYDDSSSGSVFNKLKTALSILFGKKYVTTKDFLSNKKIKGSIFEEAIKYSYLTAYYENMFDKDKKEKFTPTHPRVTEEIKKIIDVIPKEDRITLESISSKSTIDVGIYFGINPQNILTSLNENKRFTNEFKQDAWLSKSYFASDNEIASSVIVKGNETIGYIQAYNKLKILKSLLNKLRGRG